MATSVLTPKFRPQQFLSQTVIRTQIDVKVAARRMVEQAWLIPTHRARSRRTWTVLFLRSCTARIMNRAPPPPTSLSSAELFYSSSIRHNLCWKRLLLIEIHAVISRFIHKWLRDESRHYARCDDGVGWCTDRVYRSIRCNLFARRFRMHYCWEKKLTKFTKLGHSKGLEIVFIWIIISKTWSQKMYQYRLSGQKLSENCQIFEFK